MVGIPWQSSGQDSTLSLLRAWVLPLVGELRSCKLCGAGHGKKKKKSEEFFPELINAVFFKKVWASLVVQWLRACLPMQGTRVRALVWEDPTCRGATRPVSPNY